MSEWNEHNFVDKLAHASRPTNGVALCPEAELLLSAMEQDDTAEVPEIVSNHLERCPFCAEVRSRLLLFDQPETSAVDSEALDVEGRLDSWMKGFLDSQALFARASSLDATSKLLSYPGALKPRRFPKVLWTLAAAATLILALGFVYLRRSTISPAPSISTPSVDVARNTPDQPPS